MKYRVWLALLVFVAVMASGGVARADKIFEVEPPDAALRKCEGHTRVAALHYTPHDAPVGKGATKRRAGPGVDAATATAHKRKNIDDILDLVTKAADKGAKLVVTPELAVVGYPVAEEEQRDFLSPVEARPFAEPVPPKDETPTQKDNPALFPFSKLAAAKKIYIHVGLLERDGPRIYNTVVALGPNGKVLARHRKVNLIRSELAYVTAGTDVTCYQSPSLGKVGLLVCADVYRENGKTVEQSLLGRLAKARPDVAAVSAAWTVPFDPELKTKEFPKGTPPERYFSDTGRYMNAYTVASNHNYHAPAAGVFGPDGSTQSLARRRTTDANGVAEIAFGCVPRPAGAAPKAVPTPPAHR